MHLSLKLVSKQIDNIVFQDYRKLEHHLRDSASVTEVCRVQYDTSNVLHFSEWIACKQRTDLTF